MATTSEAHTQPAGLSQETADFYREAMATLEAADVPVLVGGGLVVHVVPLAVGGAAALELGAVPGGHPSLERHSQLGGRRGLAIVGAPSQQGEAEER